MIIHVIGNKGVVGSATMKVLERSGMHVVTGNDVDEPCKGVDDNKKVDIYLVCVPEKFVPSVIELLSDKENTSSKSLHVVRSTLRPDIADRMIEMDENFCVNPEFLKAHTSYWDAHYPSGILIGTRSNKQAEEIANMWEFLRVPIYKTGIKEAVTTKLVSNFHAAIVITFWNNVMQLAQRFNINVFEIARILPKIDERVSKYGSIPGSAYGGACLPKDVRQIIDMCEDEDLEKGESELAYTIEEINAKFKESDIARGGL